MEDKLLSTEQLLLLENLTYLEDDPPMRSMIDIYDDPENADGLTVGELVEQLQKVALISNKEYSTYTTGEDWDNIFAAISADDTLLNMEIKLVVDDTVTVNDDLENQINSDPEGIGRSVVFVNNETGEAVVAIRGTMPYEWRDDFLGGAPTDAKDTVSTEDQEQALEWYRSLDLDEEGYKDITVIGHSKGGNKAMYIAIRDESVSRCVSFDGQGFSDEFIDYYKDEIERRQHVISNHCVEYDYVNLLLNSVGTQVYYQGFDYGIGGLLEAHCSNTYFFYDEENRAHMRQVDGPAKEMQEINKFLNSCIRSLPEEQKIEAMNVIGTIAETGFNTGWNLEEIKKVIDEVDGYDELEYLLEYASIYAATHPKFVDAIKSLVEKFYMDESGKNIERGILALLKTTHLSKYCGWLVAGLVTSSLEGNSTEDIQIPTAYVLLEKNHVFDINKLTALGTTGKALMDAGSLACQSWDIDVADLTGLCARLPGEVKSSLLENSLDGLSLPFYNDEYDIMANKIYNTAYNIVENIPPKDEEAAQLIDEITTELSNVISVIKTMEENLVVSPM